MISLNDVLLAMSNIPVDDPIAEIWGRGLQGGYEIIEYTGTLPITITADGNAMLDYRIYGADGGVGEPTASGEPTGYKLPILSNSTVIDIYIGDTQLMPDEYADFSEQAVYHKSVPDDVRARFEQENQVTFADPEAFVSSGKQRVRIAVTAVLGEGYTCKEIGVVYSNTESLCENRDLFLYRVNGVSIKKGSSEDGSVTQAGRIADNGYGVKTVGFATISDGTYTTTIYTRILYATYERLHDSGDFTAYPPNTGQNFVPTAVTLPEIPTPAGVTVIDYDGTPKPSEMYIKYRR